MVLDESPDGLAVCGHDELLVCVHNVVALSTAQVVLQNSSRTAAGQQQDSSGTAEGQQKDSRRTVTHGSQVRYGLFDNPDAAATAVSDTCACFPHVLDQPNRECMCGQGLRKCTC